MPRFQIEYLRDAMNLDLDQVIGDVTLQYALECAAIGVPGVTATVFADDNNVGVHVEGDDAMQLRRISEDANMPWLTVLDRGEDGEGFVMLVSAAEIGRKFKTQTVCGCGATVVEFEGMDFGPYAWEGHLGICEMTPENSATLSEDQT